MEADLPVHGFLAAAQRDPDHPAIVHDGVTITYAELAAGVKEVAARLGNRPGVVGVDVARTSDTIATLLGVWLAGGTYCPLDPAFPPERRAAMRQAVSGTFASQPAYILFTSGSTGAPKPVATPARAIATVTAALRTLFAITPADRVLQFA